MGGANKHAKRGKTDDAAKSDQMLGELGAVKRLLMLQLVALGVRPVDIAASLGVGKSAVSASLPVRKLSVSERIERETILGVPARDLIDRLDTLIELARRRG